LTTKETKIKLASPLERKSRAARERGTVLDVPLRPPRLRRRWSRSSSWPGPSRCGCPGSARCGPPSAHPCSRCRYHGGFWETWFSFVGMVIHMRRTWGQGQAMKHWCLSTCNLQSMTRLPAGRVEWRGVPGGERWWVGGQEHVGLCGGGRGDDAALCHHVRRPGRHQAWAGDPPAFARGWLPARRRRNISPAVPRKRITG
jgi:hypothetical protein